MSIQTDYEKHFLNSDIWEYYQIKALKMAKNPKTSRISSKYIIETIRAEKRVKIDNRFTSRYARTFVAKYPEYKHLFELRPLLTD